MPAYSQYKAFLAITKASFRSILSNPTALFFSFLFPVIFIFIFGSFGEGNGVHYRITMSDHSDTTNEVYDSLQANSLLTIVSFKKADGSTDTAARRNALEKERLTAIVRIEKTIDSAGVAQYTIRDTLTNASGNAIAALQQIFSNIINTIAIKHAAHKPRPLVMPYVYAVREYRNIDFVLPGMLGFSILFSTLFGISFIFFQFRQQLILKRFYATPVSRMNILLGIGISRLMFDPITSSAVYPNSRCAALLNERITPCSVMTIIASGTVCRIEFTCASRARRSSVVARSSSVARAAFCRLR